MILRTYNGQSTRDLSKTPATGCRALGAISKHIEQVHGAKSFWIKHFLRQPLL